MWGSGRRVQYDLVVDPGVGALQQQLRGLFPGEDIAVTVNEEATTLSGRVSSNAVMLKAGEIAEKTSSKSKVINLLRVPGGIESQQVMLQVRFAEVNRNVLTEAGISLFTGANGEKNWVGRTSTQQFSAPNFTTSSSGNELTFSDFLNVFVFNTKYNVGAVLKALQTKGFVQSLAEPNLIAYNGKEASFLAGGEVPVPVVQGSSGLATVSVLYKEFGIRLSFTPTIAGDVIRLHVKPEVSSLDFANGVTLSGFRIPALIVRRAETEVELRDGQSFAIAGLLDNLSQNDNSQVPLLGSLPIIGHLFKSKSDRLARTELMVLITPRLVRPLASALGRLYSSAFYALRDTKTPLRFAIMRVVLTGVLGYLFCRPLRPLLVAALQMAHVPLPVMSGGTVALGAIGLTASAGIAGWLEYLLLRHGLQKRVGEIRMPPSFQLKLWLSAVAAGVAGAAFYRFVLPRLGPHLPRILPHIRDGAMVVAVFGCVYFGMAMLTGVPEAQATLRRFKR